ncbi:MAG: hypothetical protein QM703_25940 [Gemmatales bacterium]
MKNLHQRMAGTIPEGIQVGKRKLPGLGIQDKLAKIDNVTGFID